MADADDAVAVDADADDDCSAGAASEEERLLTEERGRIETRASSQRDDTLIDRRIETHSFPAHVAAAVDAIR